MNEWAGRLAGAVVTLDESGEREFDAHLRESAPLAFRVAYSVLRHRQDAEDVAQDALVKAYARFAQLRDRDRFRAWIVRTAWRSAIDKWRSDRRRNAREQTVDLDVPIASVEDLAQAQERAVRLWRAIDELPEKLRITIVLGAIEGYDVREVATLLELPEGTVKSRLFLARKALAERLQCLAKDTKRL
jgi:RNA polymerase sigma-70 factor (ECF subfamily)